MANVSKINPFRSSSFNDTQTEFLCPDKYSSSRSLLLRKSFRQAPDKIVMPLAKYDSW